MEETMQALLQGGTYQTQELTVKFGEPFTIPKGAILVAANHTFSGTYQFVLLVPDGKPMLHEGATPRQKGK